MKRQARIVVRGKVQGVFYRDSTRKKARDLGIEGTVQNRADGSVEIYAQGDETQLNELKHWCWEGSPHSTVSDVQFEELEETTSYSSFTIRY
jgi:acylphosphatase